MVFCFDSFQNIFLHYSVFQELISIVLQIGTIDNGESGRITMSDEHLTITKNGQKVKTDIKSKTQFCDVLYKNFGIDLQGSWGNDM